MQKFCLESVFYTKVSCIRRLTVNNAFLNDILKEEVYMIQPPRFVSSNKLQVCVLHKAIYGLKKAPRAWFNKLKATFLSLKFSSSKCDPSLFGFLEQVCVYILANVNDIIVMGNNIKLIHSLVSQLNFVFSLKDLGDLDYFLGILNHL